MPDQPVVLPFTVTNLFAGLARRRGLAKASASELTLEFVINERELDANQTGRKEIHVPTSDITAVRLQQGWLGSKVHIRVRSTDCLAGLPGCENGELILHVARSNRVDAADFVQALSGG